MNVSPANNWNINALISANVNRIRLLDIMRCNSYGQYSKIKCSWCCCNDVRWLRTSSNWTTFLHSLVIFNISISRETWCQSDSCAYLPNANDKINNWYLYFRYCERCAGNYRFRIAQETFDSNLLSCLKVECFKHFTICTVANSFFQCVYTSGSICSNTICFYRNVRRWTFIKSTIYLVRLLSYRSFG